MELSTVNANGGSPLPDAGLHADLFNHKPHQEWARRVARSEWRGLPPSFALEDLEQEALIAMWKQSERYDPSRAVPFQAFAYRAVRGAILMACRRRPYREATHDELKLKDHPTDTRPNAEQALLDRREQKLRSQLVAYRLQKVEDLMAGFSAADAFLVKRAFIDGVPAETLVGNRP
jgi:RNA polymerase sigma factor (sigma-70 family)